MKLLVITSTGFTSRDGIATVVFDYLSRFDNNKFDIHIAVSGNYNPDVLNDFKSAGMVPCFLPSRNKHLLRYVSALNRLCRQNKYDAVYVHGSSALLAIDLWVAKHCGCRVRVAHSHNTTCDHKFADRVLRPFFYRLYTDAFACGQAAGEWLYGKRPFKIIKNGRDVGIYRFDPDKRKLMRRELGVADNCLCVGHVGNFNRQKNQSFLIYSFAELLKKHDNAILFLMGEGYTKAEDEELAASLHISDKVVFMGTVSNVPQILQAMDVMALPSLFEGLPLVAVEWQISALPCIISDCVTRECAFTDLVEFMSLSSGHEAWADALLKYREFDRAHNAEKAVEAAQAHGFDIDKNAQTLQLYFEESCCDKRENNAYMGRS